MNKQPLPLLDLHVIRYFGLKFNKVHSIPISVFGKSSRLLVFNDLKKNTYILY